MKLILLLAGLALAQDATIQKMTGKVSIKAEGDSKFVKGKTGDTLLYGDSVRTGSKSMAHVVFASGPAILVQENSSLVIQGGPERTLVNFKLGEFLIGLRQKLAAGRTFRVKTPAAVAAVRGTLFWGRINPDKSSEFAALENEVEVSAGKKIVVLKPGEKTMITLGGAPTDPAPAGIPADYPQKTFGIDGSIQGLEELLQK